MTRTHVPTHDRTSRCATDARLRRHGFKIAARPKHGPAWWEKSGCWYPEHEALLRCKQVDGLVKAREVCEMGGEG